MFEFYLIYFNIKNSKEESFIITYIYIIES